MSGFVSWLLTPILHLANRWDWLGRRLNRWLINSLVNVARNRPHPFSTVHDYTSWTSLTDMHWSARLLPAKHQAGLPEAEQVLALFARGPQGQRYCEKSTLLFPAFAQYLTDGFIRTRMRHEGEPEDVLKQNTSNHQIDLSPLYGRTPEQTAQLRLRSEAAGARGRLKSQTIQGEEYAPFLMDAVGAVKAEFNALDEPLGLSNQQDPGLRAAVFAFGGDRANATPQVAMINTLFLREHNRLAAELETRQPDWDDERVFQVARNIVIVLFLKVVIEEYINHITPSPFRFRADCSVAHRAIWNRPNWITAEFSLLYRWHSLIPESVDWLGKTRPVSETFMDNRPLLEAGLARAFRDIASQRAGRLGPFNTPAALLPVERKAIAQGRLVALAPYADYRVAMKRGRARSFGAITPNKDAAALLKSVYANAAQVDFYVGLFAEEPVKNSPLPPLILSMVAMDAFSQAMTNPLLSEHVFNAETFTPFGWALIQQPTSLRDILSRNVAAPLGDARITMTRAGWRPRWW